MNTFNLKPHDHLGLIALASPINPEHLKVCKEVFQENNYFFETPLDPSLYYGKYDHMFASNTVKKRLEAFSSLVDNSKLKYILSVRGGYGSMELLPNMDFSEVVKSEKILIGYSDITAMLNAIVDQGGIAVHAPGLQSFLAYREKSEVKLSFDALINLLSGKVLDSSAYTKLELISGSGHTAGLVIGGNLSVLVAMIGTKYLPDFSDKILFIEETGEKPYRVHRMLMQLKLTGLLSKLNGVVFGDMASCNHEKDLGPKVEQVIKDIFKDFKYPVYMGLSAGHTHPNYPVILGLPATLNEHSLSYSF